VKHSFNTKGTANYRVQLAVPPSINNNYNNHNTVLKKSQQTSAIKKIGIFNWSRDYIVDRKQVLKQAGVVDNIKSQ